MNKKQFGKIVLVIFMLVPFWNLIILTVLELQDYRDEPFKINKWIYRGVAFLISAGTILWLAL